jgi:hypothetical protein
MSEQPPDSSSQPPSPEEPSYAPPPPPQEAYAPPPPVGGELASPPPPGVERKSSDERKQILAQQLQMASARGRRVESQQDFQAVLIEGKPVNNTLHAILTFLTCLVWGIVWIIISATGGEKRELILVDEWGNVQYQRMGKA